MSFSLHGQAVSGGIAIGRAHLISHAMLEVAQYQVRERDVPAELNRLEKALTAVKEDLGDLKEEASAPGAPTDLSGFVELHAMILEDAALTETVRELIRERRCNAEWALVQQMQHVVAQFEEFEDAYLRERKQDIMQVVERVLRVLQNKPRKLVRRKAVPGSVSDDALIVVANDLSPADTIQFKSQNVSGFITDVGGATSHTAILARGLALPAIVGMQNARPMIQDDDVLIVDGTRGILIVDPDARILEEYRLRKWTLELARTKLNRLKTAQSSTLDGVAVQLLANIEDTQDAEEAKAVGAAGVGLFRTEFLFMNRSEVPGEDEQFEVYRSVVKIMAGKPVTLRTLDIGADKDARALRNRASSLHPAPNPALGLRAIRYCLSEPQFFLIQLRAILRASHYGKVRLLIPMLAHAHEIEQTLALIDRAKMQLRETRHKFDDGMEVGGMVEIPAAALALGPFLRKLDFLSIGTNDLIQYTLAIDRSDGAVAHLYDPLHPAVLSLIGRTIHSGERVGLPVAICGEMAGDPKLTRLLIGMGLRQFSMHPAQLLEVKQQVMMADAGQLGVKVARLTKLDDADRIREQVEKL